jgi:hypothetical protein
MAGYSKRTLPEKLGIKPGYKCRSLHAPKGYAKLLAALPARTDFGTGPIEECDFIHAFYENAAEFRAELPQLRKGLKKNGALWVSWRKGKVSDLTENVVRSAALSAGLVDVKVCAVDEVWSGLKLVIRLENR